MKKFNTIVITLCFLTATLVAMSCKKEDVDPCQTADVTFSGTIMPLMNAQCLVCHSQSAGPLSGNNVVLAQYSDFATYTTSGRLVKALEYNDSLIKMPPTGKLDTCDIARVRSWVTAGAPNN